MGMPGEDWTRVEVEACVADYIHMLTLELAGQKFNKTAHRRALAKRLNKNRSEDSIELKHRNISAVMLDLDVPYVSGYKPLPHYQRLLVEVVAQQLQGAKTLDDAALAAVERPATAPLANEVEPKWVEPPKVRRTADAPPEYLPSFQPVKRDYLAREASNQSLGLAGEVMIAESEARRLHALGKKSLSRKVEHVARTRGDGLGYDVLSFDEDGRERFIEVKTTAFGEATPFYVSKNELALSKQQADRFHLYRLFSFRAQPKFFVLSGLIGNHCRLDAVSYLAKFQ